MNSGIYKILNKTNNKVYIGSSVNLKNREYKHFWMLKKNIHDNKFLQKSFNRDGLENFVFEVLENCDLNLLIDRENHYINDYKSNNYNFGYNLATVNEFRRNTFNDVVKLKLSKHNLKKNRNILNFNLIEMSSNKISKFDNLFDAAKYLINEGFTTGSERNVRQKLSYALRGKKINNGHNGSIRKTIYKHYFETINY
jgi:group I intron endonuclease